MGMSNELVAQAAVISPPGAPLNPTKENVLANTAAATAIDLNSVVGKWIWVKSDIKVHVRFESTSTASTVTTTDMYLTPDVDYPFYVPVGGKRRYLKHKGAGSTGKIRVVAASDDLDGAI